MKADLLQTVDDSPFVVALKVEEADVGIAPLKFFEKILKASASVYLGFADTEDVEVRSVDNMDDLHKCLICHIAHKLYTHQLDFLQSDVVL